MSTYDELVERAATALCERTRVLELKFDQLPEHSKRAFQVEAKRALDAAGVPALLAERDTYKEALGVAEVDIQLIHEALLGSHIGRAALYATTAINRIAARAALSAHQEGESPSEPHRCTLDGDTCWVCGDYWPCVAYTDSLGI